MDLYRFNLRPMRFAFLICGVLANFAVRIAVDKDLNILTTPSMRVTEGLVDLIKPSDVILITGGDSVQRRTSGFGLLTSTQISKLGELNGFPVVFLDQLDYDRRLQYKGVTYSPAWSRVFALPTIRAKYPDAKYFVWMDDDILVLRPETKMLNHYMNMLEQNPEWQVLVGAEGGHVPFNTGFLMVRNSDFALQIMSEKIELALSNNGKLARSWPYDQGALTRLRELKNLTTEIQVIPRRDCEFNFNTFPYDHIGYVRKQDEAEFGDAFIHFVGGNRMNELRLEKMQMLLDLERMRLNKIPISDVSKFSGLKLQVQERPDL